MQGQNTSTTSCHENQEDLDMPIALRKGVRSCTKHPISNFVTSNRLSPKLQTFVHNVSLEKLSKMAAKAPDWRGVINEEIRALEQNKTWDIVDLPSGKTIVGCKWIFTIKYNQDGSINRYKARLVAKGFS